MADMTFGLDISHHQDLGLDLARCKREGIAFVFLKATEGSGFVDSEFAANLAEARQAGLMVAAYHYVRLTATAAAQVAHIGRVVPKDVPVIPDVESGSGGVPLVRDLIDRLRQTGYRVPLLYLPRWYWQQLGSPSLAGLPPLWSSRYPDNVVSTIPDEWADVPARYWDGYGGLPVAVLQFTSSAAVAGHQPLDANAYRGTPHQLAALLGGAPFQEDDMPTADEIRDAVWNANLNGKSARTHLEELNREATARYGIDGRPGPDEDTQYGHILSTRAELRKLGPGAAVDPAHLVEAMASSGTFMDGLASRLAVQLADEQDRRARDNNPSTGPTT